jgi:Putative peptidoglycan binding domain
MPRGGGVKSFHLVLSDPRVTYVIWNRQIFNNDRAAEGWRLYTGQNPHNHHMHVSIRSTARDVTSPWPWSGGGSLGPVPAIAPVPYGGVPLHSGSRGGYVMVLQIRLNALGELVGVDGDFGPGTVGAVQQFQRKRQLKPDGVVGPKTWAALWP